MEEKVKKISFFKKVWYSITKFEQYPTMAMEGLGRAIKYLIILIAIISIFMTLCYIQGMKESSANASIYIKENIPEFKYSNGNLAVESEDTIIINDLENTGFDRIIINTLIETDEEKEKIEKDNSSEGISIIFFRDQIILKIQMEGNETVKQEYTYRDIINSFVGENIEEFDKSQFVQYLTSGNMTIFYSTYALSMYAYYFTENFIVAIVYSLEIALLGWITTITLRIKMRFKPLYNMSVYAITLPTVLGGVYFIVNYFTQFTIKEFQIAYIAIAYIYIATVLFILKDDFIKKMQEVEQIKKEQLRVREEIQEEENKKQEDKEEDEEKKEDDKGDEPQGSEV